MLRPLLCSLFLVLSLATQASAELAREARQGVLDLKYWRFDHQPWLELSGEWLQYQGQLLNMSELADQPLTQVMATPDMPLDCDRSAESLCTATYVLELRHLPLQPLSIIIPELSGAFRLTWNGRLVAEGGQISRNPDLFEPYVGHRVAHIKQPENRAVLVLQVADTGLIQGPRRDLVMGEASYIQARFAQGELLEALSAAISAIGCLLLFLQQRARRKYESGLWGLALFGLATTLYTLTEGFTVLQWLIPNPDWALMLQLNAAAQYLFVPALVVWLSAAYPDMFPQAYRLLNRLQLLLVPLIPWVPVSYLTAQESWQMLYNLTLGMAGFYWLLRYRGEASDTLNGLKFTALVVAVAAVHDVLLYQRMMSGMDWLPLGFTAFLVTQIFRLAVQRARQHTAVDATNQVLSAERTQLKQRLELRTAELAEKSRQLEQVRAERSQLQHFDGLTGLLRQNRFLEEADHLLDGGDISGHDHEPISLILLDLDRYKHIGAMFGPVAADQAMKDVADLLDKWTEPGQLVGRLEGESFALLLPGFAEQDAIHEAEWLRLRISQRSVAVDDLADEPGQVFHITASFGVCALIRAEADIKTMMDAAESALNRAKANGRNSVMGYHQLASLPD